jgi:broad specificity phosphatase PhoE
MSVLYVVRHAQASFFTQNYDQLSRKGVEQSRLLGRYWVENEVEIGEVYAGSLSRQLQTAQAVGEIFRRAGKPWPGMQVLDGLNEYGAGNVMEHLRAELVEQHEHVRRLSEAFERATEDRERYRTFHLLLEALMRFYIAGDYRSRGFESWRQFHDRVSSSLAHIRSQPGRGRRVAVFTSGGPVGVSVQTTLQAPEQQAGELNWRVYNASVTTFTFRADRISLDQFNSIAHLTTEELRTYR